MFCPNCGSSQPDQNTFCTNCNSRLPKANNQQQAQYNPAPTANYGGAPYQNQNQNGYASPYQTTPPPGYVVQPQTNQPPQGYGAQPQMNQPPQGYSVQPQMNQPPQGYVAQPYATQPTPGYTVQPPLATAGANPLPMKWYKFLIYFALFLSTLSGIGTAIMYINGTVYSPASAEAVYELYGSALHGWDMFFAFSQLVFAFLALVTRFRLAAFKKNGPTLVYLSYAIPAIVAVLYTMAVESIISNNPYINEAAKSMLTDSMTDSLPASIAISLAMIVLNMKYFTRRKHLFCN